MDIISKAVITTLTTDIQELDNADDIKRLYNELKRSMRQHYGDDSDLLQAIEGLESKPDSTGRKVTLGEEIIANRVNLEAPIRKLALDLLDEIHPRYTPSQQPDSSPVPMQRPPRPKNFIGREAEVNQLIDLLMPKKTINVTGPAGIGKGDLISAAVWELTEKNTLSDKFPDGIIYLSFYLQPRVDKTLEEIVRVFNEDPIPSSYEAAERLLADRQLLLILDGIENADDLHGILALQDKCCLVLTSRGPLPEHVQVDETLTLQPLSDEQAVNLLRAWTGKVEQESAGRICELLGNLPLAIQLAGQDLATQQHSAEDLRAWLESTPLASASHSERVAAGLPLIIKHNLSHVSSTARQALAITGLLAPMPFDQEVVARTLTIKPNQGLFASIRGFFRQKPVQQTTQIRMALRELASYGLLQWSGERYQVSHPQIYLYIQKEMTPPVKTVRRLATYFMAVAWEQSANGPAGVTRLEADRHHFVKIMSECIEWKEWEAAHGLAAAVEDFLDRQGHLSDRVTANEIGLMAAWQLGRPSEGAWLGNLGDTYRTMGHAKWAIEHFEKALATARQTSDRHGEGNSLGNLGLAYRDLGQIDQALTHLQQSLAIFEEIGSPSASLVRDWLYELKDLEED